MEERDIHDNVWLEPWDPEWPREFHLEKQCVVGALIDDGGSVSVRHVGSTSIEGMPAKPVIDMLVCPDKSVPLESCVTKLERIGYRNLGECGRPGRYFLSRGGEPGKTFYVHLCYEDHPVARDQLLFQKLLRDSEPLRARYRYTKHMLEGIFPDDRDMYRATKGLFIMGVLAGYRQALAERSETQ